LKYSLLVMIIIGFRRAPRDSNRLNVPRMFTLFALVTVALLSSLSCARQTDQSRTEIPKKIINVKDFGAKGDGRSDDYDALQAAATAVCQSPSATLLFPEGTYRIDRYRITGGPRENKVQNVRFIGCKGNTITGVKAKIEVDGDFRRGADKKEDSYSISYADSVVPFEMIQSSGFRIIGFEIAGNVEKMSRDPNVAVGGAAGILTIKSRDYFIEDVTVRGFAGDGIRLGEDSQSADEGAHLLNVTSTHNARQGLAIINVRGADVVNSVFSNNGRTGGYGSHAPAAGVTIEPVRYASEQDPAGGITFDKCRFEENIGPQFLAGRPDLVDSLTIKNSYIKSTLPDTNATAFISDAKVGLVQGSVFDIASGHGVALAGYSPSLYGSISRLIYSKNTFNLGDNKGLIAPLQPAPIELVGNNIRVESGKKDPTLLRLDYLKLAENNTIFEANRGYSDVHPTILYEKGNGTIRNNRYETDRTEPGYFDVYYGPGVVASGEIFHNLANFKRY
jgi:hypothetical protein